MKLIGDFIYLEVHKDARFYKKEYTLIAIRVITRVSFRYKGILTVHLDDGETLQCNGDLSEFITLIEKKD